jgi:hypothetical protein
MFCENRDMRANIEKLRQEVAALKEAISSHIPQPVVPDVARIGGVVYSDLTSLNVADLQQLDVALTEYR